MTRTAPRTGSPLSLHDALPILQLARAGGRGVRRGVRAGVLAGNGAPGRLVAAPAELDRLDLRSAELPRRWRRVVRSEEHTSELQSLTNLVCRLLLEKKNTTIAG